jgi:predicted kinase
VEHGAPLIFVECTCPRDVVLQRLARRWEQRVQGKRASFTGSAQASDGRPELYDKQRANWEDLDASEKSVMQHYSLKTTLHLAVNVEQVLDCLQISRLACFMNASERL